MKDRGIEVLFLCTGNLCRSPMAEALLRAELARRGVEDVSVRSSGTWAGDGHPATAEAVEVLGRRGIDLSSHRSRSLEEGDLERADIIVVMTSVHEREVLGMLSRGHEKVVLLKGLAEMHPDYGDTGGPGGRLGALIGAPRPPRRRALDVDDPMGLPKSSYERCCRELSAGVEVLAEALSPDRGA